jgi:predicted ATP-grasp superfamily ATP-dependent carboligase
VYAILEDRYTPAGVSRYLAGAVTANGNQHGSETLLSNLAKAGEQMGRPAILIPTDDLAAIFIAEHAGILEKWFWFPRSQPETPQKLANKKDLYFTCKTVGVPCPATVFPTSMRDVSAFIETADFPVVVKAQEPQRRPKHARSVFVARNPEELLSLYRQTEDSGIQGLLLQEYIPRAYSEDWIFHGYVNPTTGSFVGFTGRKFRSYPPFAGSTTLGVSVPNDSLSRQAEALLKATGYAGIVDLDYRFDKRDGQYNLLDFNPRVGANFRMFEDSEGLDVVRALHLDLTGKTVKQSRVLEGRTFVVEPHDVLATVSYMQRDGLTIQEWWQSLQGPRELAWFSWDDPLPFLMMSIRLLLRAFGRIGRRVSIGLRKLQDDQSQHSIQSLAFARLPNVRGTSTKEFSEGEVHEQKT